MQGLRTVGCCSPSKPTGLGFHCAEATGAGDQGSQGGDSKRELVKCGGASRLEGSVWG